MTTAYVTHPRCVEHHLREHPEHAGRIRAVWKRMDESGLAEHLEFLQAPEATIEQITAVHDAAYVALLETTRHQTHTLHLDADTYINPASYDVARLSAGGVVRAVDHVFAQPGNNALVVTRPPGHHAIASRGMGFCLFNNVAIGAQHAIDAYALRRVLIVDYDVHHGNGTEAIFHDRPDVMFMSTHQYPLYPMTGLADDTGKGIGEGYTLNVPLPAHCGDNSYRAVFDQIVLPAAERYQPELILVSAGYDAHWAEPLAGMQLTLTGFAELGQRLIDAGKRLCEGRIIFVMEGGYYVEALAYGMVNVARLLTGQPPTDPIGPPDFDADEPDLSRLIELIRTRHNL